MDIREGHTAGSITALTYGYSGSLSIWYIEKKNCKKLGKALARFLAGEEQESPTWVITRMAPTPIGPNDAITLMLEEFNGEFSQRKEEKVFGCIEKHIREMHPTVEVFPPEKFRSTAFSGLAPEEIPPKPWEEILNEMPFRSRIAPLRLRYLISIRGYSNSK